MQIKRDMNLLPCYRVLDLTDEKGVFCGKLLGDLGADVIKVEPPGGDRMRSKGPFYNGEVHPEKSLHFLYFNTSKSSITLNLEHADGREIFKQLVKTADALVESFPVGYLEGLDLGYSSLQQVNSRLVMASISPFGQTGAFSGLKSSDLVVMGMSGYMQMIGDPWGPPLRFGNEQSTYPPSQYAAVGIVAALYYRDSVSGRGQYIDVSMQEALITYYQEQFPAATWTTRGENVIRQGPTHPIAKPGGLYACKDGWTSIIIVIPEEWDALAQWMHEVTGNEEILDEKFRGGLISRIQYLDLIDALFSDFAGRLTAKELFEEGQRRQIGVHPVNDVSDMLADPQLAARGFWMELDHPAVGPMSYPKGAWYSEDILPPRKSAPLLGQDNRRIYCDELGYTDNDLAVMRTAGII
ncbi:MAG: CoA transferase [Dehalococcoidia bacterium]|nr:CoA transferase [Dehalococcoidia bacterium]